jgi:hypothetical protein
MDILRHWFYGDDESENVDILNKKVKKLYKPCMLTQGKKLHYNQAEKVNALSANLQLFNEDSTNAYTNTSPYAFTNTYANYVHVNTYANGDTYSNANTYSMVDTYKPGLKTNNRPFCQEGFDTIASTQTNAKNNAELADTTLNSMDFAKKIDRYKSEYPSLLAKARSYTQGTDRTKNVKAAAELNRDIGMKYDITTNKEGCYKQSAGAALEYQADIKDVNLDTCKMRALDLGYAGFSIKNAGGQLGCYLTNSVDAAKSDGIATKPMTSFAFKTNSSANMGSLLKNGQIGIFQDKITNNVTTDLVAVAGCSMSGKSDINTSSIVATYGGNCNRKL